MDQRITLVTLGVRDFERSVAFYEGLGWRRAVRAATGVAFFQCGGVALSLFPRAALAADPGVAESGMAGSGAFALAQNARTKGGVDAAMREAAALGAEIVKPARDTDWGGYAGYFRDPDGHLREIAWNPGFPLDDDGAVRLPD
ncbi:VOC family protein [Pikeienuella piscinae]|uniref:VOC family protein n=1 Tax=Pikeienuella piscinae TaxID=2748098 RepID=A0A7L5C1I2_9RHOB|nr:VOC family protein [Pikeienuella piscinae]QIE55709.1 VOC family protein [Pikeienuella piscinae]